MRSDDDTVGMATGTAAGGHERRDADLRWILVAGAGLVLVGLIVHVALWLQLHALWRARQREEAPAPPVAAALPDRPPEPRLESEPRENLTALRAEEDAILHSYGWVDRKGGIVRIPIERAMELVLEGR